MPGMRILFHWLISTIAILIAAYIVPGSSVTLEGAFIAAVVLSALNLFIRPILVVLTLPITILTLGFFSLVINALLVMLAAAIVPGFAVAGFWTALFFALVLSVINWVFHFWGKAA
jgi:putative membrane protein